MGKKEMGQLLFKTLRRLVAANCILLVGAMPPDSIQATASEAARDGLVMSHDFGVVRPGELLEHQFEVRNATDEDIVILRNQVSCGCLSVIDSPKRILAGQTVNVALRLDTAGRHGQDIQTCVLSVQNSKLDYISFRLNALLQGIWAEPMEVDFGSRDNQTAMKRQVDIFAAGLSAAEITEVAVEDDWIAVESEFVKTDTKVTSQGIKALQRMKVDCLKTQLSPGLHRTHIVISTNQTSAPFLRIPVVAHFPGAMEMRPSKILFGNVKVGDTVRRECTVSLPAKLANRVRDITFVVDHSSVHASIDPEITERGSLHATIVLTLSGDDKQLGVIKGAAVGTIEEAPQVSVPYIGFVSK